MKKLLVVLLVAVTLLSCRGKALETKQSNNSEFEVELLFEHDGVKVYRFWDSSSFHYFTSKGETMTSQKSGKTTYEENIQ
jgi:hypothetical protein